MFLVSVIGLYFVLERCIMMVFCALLLYSLRVVFAQEDWSVIYRDIEENNIELKAMLAQNHQEVSAIRSQHALPNPQVDGFYLLPMEAAGTDYVELEITQGIGSPFLYGARTKKEDLLHEKLAFRSLIFSDFFVLAWKNAKLQIV